MGVWSKIASFESQPVLVARHVLLGEVLNLTNFGFPIFKMGIVLLSTEGIVRSIIEILGEKHGELCLVGHYHPLAFSCASLSTFLSWLSQ